MQAADGGASRDATRGRHDAGPGTMMNGYDDSGTGCFCIRLLITLRWSVSARRITMAGRCRQIRPVRRRSLRPNGSPTPALNGAGVTVFLIPDRGVIWRRADDERLLYRAVSHSLRLVPSSFYRARHLDAANNSVKEASNTFSLDASVCCALLC